MCKICRDKSFLCSQLQTQPRFLSRQKKPWRLTSLPPEICWHTSCRSLKLEVGDQNRLKGSAWSQSRSIRVCPTVEFQHLQSVAVCSRPCGERLQLRWSPHFEPVQPGPPGTFPQRGRHRGGAGGTDAALRRWSQEGRTQAGRMARHGLRSVKDGTDGNVLCGHPEHWKWNKGEW